MSDPQQPPPPHQGRPPSGPPGAYPPAPGGAYPPPPGGGQAPAPGGAYPPPPGGLGAPPPPGSQGWGQQGPYSQYSQFSQPAAQPFTGGYPGPDWIPEIDRQLGSAGTRIGAKAIDIVFYMIVQFVVGLGAAALFFASSDFGDDFTTGSGFTFGTTSNLGLGLLIATIALVIDFLYNVVLPARFGGQPGKLIVGLRIVRTDGAPLDLAVAFRRWSPILALSVLAFVPIGDIVASLGRFVLLITNLVMVLSDPRRRSVFDRVAGTYVVTAK